jgi:hypothetical protein
MLSVPLFSQEDDLLALLGDEEPSTNYVNAAFKTNRVINLHSIENTSHGVLDFKIGHRFGFLNGGFYELFGLDNASIRLGFDYGLTKDLQIGVGRSSYEKTYDGYLKYRILHQSTGKRNMPITLSGFASMAVQTLRWRDPDRENYFSSRLYYTFQLIAGRKFSESFSAQISPTLVHRNLVSTTEEANDVYSIGFAARQKLSKRIALTAEYIYLLPDLYEGGQAVADGFRNSFSIGVDIETGGHVFQLHFTNSTSMIEKGFITETVGRWNNGGVHFGFNVSRVFTIVRPDVEL